MYKAGSLNHGQGRVFVMAYKLRTRSKPFIDIPLVDSQAAGALGEAGASGWIDTHFSERFLGAMMVGMIPDLSQAGNDSNLLIVFYVQIMPDDFVMQLHRF